MKKFLTSLIVSLFLIAPAHASISVQTNKIFGSGNNVTTSFTYPFKVFKNTDLQVYEIDPNGTSHLKSLSTDYTVAISTATEGGFVNFTAAPPTGWQTLIKRVEPYTQSLVLASEGALPAKQIENQLDLAMMDIIQLNESVSRGVQLPITSTLTNVTLPAPISNMVIGWNTNATSLENKVAIDGDSVAAAAASATAANASAGAASGYATDANNSAVAAAASAASINITVPVPIASGGTGQTSLAAANISVYSDKRFVIGTITRAMNATSGDVPYTGLGIAPKCVIFMGFTGTGSNAAFGFGNNITGLGQFQYNNGTIWSGNNPGTVLIFTEDNGSNNQIAELSSLDTDGFTLTWTKQNSPSSGTATVTYLAIR